MKLDSLDKNLLKHLQKDARLSLRELGRILGVPHTTIFTRVNKLLKNGVIRNFRAILHPHELGFKVNMVVIEPTDNPKDTLADDLAEHESVMKVYKSDDGRIFVKAIDHCDPDCKSLKYLTKRLYGYDYQIHSIEEIVKYDNVISDTFINRLK